MPQIADLIVKAADGTTDITYGAQVPSSGTAPAIWTNTSVGNAPAHRPEFRLILRDGVKGSSDRRVGRATFVYPWLSTNTTTAITSAVGRLAFSADWQISKAIPQNTINEAVAQYSGLLKHALVIQCLQLGRNAT